MHGFCLTEVRGSPPLRSGYSTAEDIPHKLLSSKASACGSLRGFVSPPAPLPASFLHRERHAWLALGLRSFHQRHCISGATESKRGVGWARPRPGPPPGPRLSPACRRGGPAPACRARRVQFRLRRRSGRGAGVARCSGAPGSGFRSSSPAPSTRRLLQAGIGWRGSGEKRRK